VFFVHFCLVIAEKPITRSIWHQTINRHLAQFTDSHPTLLKDQDHSHHGRRKRLQMLMQRHDHFLREKAWLNFVPPWEIVIVDEPSIKNGCPVFPSTPLKEGSQCDEMPSSCRFLEITCSYKGH